MKLRLSEITVGERFRKEFVNIAELAESIKKYGLIEPIVVDEDNHLIAGERRVKAHQLLKLEEISVKRLRGLSPLEKKEVELEENIQRKAFTWQEEINAKSQLHVLKQELRGKAIKGHNTEGTWKIKDTAQALGESVGTVSMDIQLARGMKAFPELMKEKSKTTAYKKFKVLQESVLQNELAKRLKHKGVLDVPDIIHADCLNHLKTMNANSVDLVLTDPPYGIDIGSSDTFGKSSLQKTYSDDDFETFDLLDKVFSELNRVLKDDRHAVFFCGIDKFPRVVQLLEKHGFWVHHLPLIWNKGSGSYASQGTTFTHAYECFVHARKGVRKINGTPKDIFDIKRVPSNAKIHPSEKPAELIRELISLLSLPGEIVFDGFAGSGVVAESARDTNRRAIVVEKDKAYHMTICKRLSKNEKE